MKQNLPKLAVLASGNGGNLQAILDEIKKGTIPATLRVVVCDRTNAFALKRAEDAGIESLCISPKSYPSREEFDQAMAALLKERGVDCVLLAGFMRILTPELVRPFWGKLLNIHPALLPQYPGTHSIERAWKAGEKEVGVTVHFVDEGVDTGPIIVQEGLQVKPGETLESLTERIHGLEHRLYPEAIRRVLSGQSSMPKRER